MRETGQKMTENMIVHCLFEQSGTFKNEFRKLGIDAYDYDILNDFNQTDYVIDLFNEIRGGFEGKPSIFDNIKKNDLIFAFFPCTRFEDQILLWFRGQALQQKNWDDIKKLQYSMKLHNELHDLYELICMLVIIAKRRDLKMIIENPYSQQHYLTKYWCIKPSLIDKNRREDGDYYIKSTQYFFINCKVQNNICFEPIEFVERIKVKEKSKLNVERKVRRSLIHPQYARRFIKQYILEEGEK